MITVMGMLFLLSHLPGDATDLHLPAGVDKLLHGAAYALLAVTVLFALPGPAEGGSSGRNAVLTLIVCLIYGLLDEWHQSFVPGRDASGLDLLADGAGALLVVVVWVRLGRGTKDEGRRTKDERRGTRDEGRGMRDEGRGTKDEG